MAITDRGGGCKQKVTPGVAEGLDFVYKNQIAGAAAGDLL